MKLDSLTVRVLVVLGLLFAGSTSDLHSAEGDGAARDRDVSWRRDLQQQVREQARSLLERVVDVQLRNLEENKLQELPIYREIRDMRAGVDDLIESEMRRVVELLEEAHSSPESTSAETHAQVREITREIVSRLSSERLRIARRLKSVELRSGVEKLIEAQERTAAQTASLSELPPDRQEAELQTALEGQLDVRQRFLNLEKVLRDVSQWRGEAGAKAATALRALDAARAEQEFEQAMTAFGDRQPSKAIGHQQSLLQSFRKIADQLGPSGERGGADETRAKPNEKVQRLLDEQTAIHDKTREAASNGPETDALVESQTSIRRELEELGSQYSPDTDVRKSLEAARTSADSSRRHLFDGDRDQALIAQEQVLSALKRAGNQLSDSEDVGGAAKTAGEAAASVRQLQDLARQMQDVARLQAQASRQAISAPEKSKDDEAGVAAALQDAASKAASNSATSTRLADAREAAAAAAKALENSTDADYARKAVDRADRAVERAVAEVQAALNDVRRRALALKAGELSRAAEALDRAAAAQRDVAEAFEESMRSGRSPEDAAQDLTERERQIRTVSEKVSAGVAEAESTTANLARESHEAVTDAERALSDVATSRSPNEMGDRKALTQTHQAADRLSQTAGAIREEVESLAQDLANEASRQAKEVAAAREAVEHDISNAPAALADEARRIASARKKVREAQAEQLRAAGKPGAARIQELEDSIREALEQQQAASAAAERAFDERASTAEALDSQRSAMKAIDELAPMARDAGESLNNATRAIDQAARAGQRAARALLDGNHESSLRDRKAAEGALLQALTAANEKSSEAANQPADKPAADAQKRVGEAIAESRKLAAKEAREIDEPLGAAERASRQAEAEIQEAKPESAARAQNETAASLAAADSRLRQLAEKNGSQLAPQLAEDARRAGKLAPAAAPDPESLATLRAAEEKAQDAQSEPRERATAQLQARTLMQQAAESLATREQMIRRDEASARSMAESAARQIEAAREIMEQRAELTKEPRDEEEPELPDDQDPQAKDDPQAIAEAARRLTAASDQFSQAQRGTGKRAEEIAGQSQIANSPLQEALEMASSLGEGTMSGTQAKGQAAGGNAPSDSSAEGGQSQGQPGSMGTGFVPDSPETTAQMLAGARAMAKAGGGAGEGAGGEPSDENEGSPSPGGSKKGGPGSGSPSDADAQDQAADGPGSSTGRGAGAAPSASAPGDRDGEIDPSSRPVSREEPWLLKLPREMRQAIRARAQRPPPRRYEDRLKRYFESVR